MSPSIVIIFLLPFIALPHFFKTSCFFFLITKVIYTSENLENKELKGRTSTVERLLTLYGIFLYYTVLFCDKYGIIQFTYIS